jgi:hypothetical protein
MSGHIVNNLPAGPLSPEIDVKICGVRSRKPQTGNDYQQYQPLSPSMHMDFEPQQDLALPYAR